MSGPNALRVVAVGQASPRWKGAKSNAEADKKNWNLARQRADNVRVMIEAQLRKKLPDVKINPGVSQVEQPDGVEVGSYGVGSTQSIQRVKGDRKSNEQVDRTVEITIERISTQDGSVAVADPNKEQAAKSWEVAIARYYVDTAGVALGYIRFKLKKWATGEVMEGEAFLWGGGLNTDVLSNPPAALTNAVKNRLKSAATDLFGHKFLSFSTDDNMIFHDFDGRWITMAKGSAQIGIGVGILTMTFRGLGSDARFIPIEKGMTYGLPNAEGYVVSGKISMIPPYPGGGSSVLVPTQRVVSNRDSVIVNFDTEDATIPAKERPKVETFITTWADNFKSS